MKRSFIREILESIDEETISFAGGLPNEALFPLQDLQEANAKVYEDEKNLQYTLSNGILSLREKIADFYNEEGFETTAENILVTTGSQQALYVIAKYFQNASIVIEKPSYLGAVNIFRMNSMHMKDIDLQSDGITMKGFKKEYAKSKLAYLIPDFQNPMASLYSKKKREKIAKFIAKTGGYLIEDAPYSELYYKNKSTSISSLIPENSMHLGSFSKTLSPSLRIGWVRANKEMIQNLLKIKETIDLHSCSIAQHTLNNYLDDRAKYKRHLTNLRAAYREKMEFFTKALKKYLPEFEFVKPKGGMFVYGSLKGIDTFKLVQECMKAKVIFVPANQFFLDKKASDAIRFNFTHSSNQEIEEGLKKIALIYKKEKKNLL